MGMSATTAALIVPAPAKVNLFLHVTGRRDDGYHLLESLIVPIDWCDTIALSPRSDAEIVRAGEVAGVPEADDLAIRAARALRDYLRSRRPRRVVNTRQCSPR